MKLWRIRWTKPTRENKKSKKSSDQQEMEQTPLQPSKSELAQLPAGDSPTPATSPAARTESTIPQTNELAQIPAIHAGVLTRTGLPCVVLHDIHSSISRISPMSGPLFTEDRLNSSSEQDMCDQEVTTIICENTPTRSPTHTVTPRPGSKTETDPCETDLSPIMGLACEKISIVNTHNYLFPERTGRRILDIPILERRPFVLESRHTAYQIQLETLEPILETRTYLLNRLTGQFFAVYDDGYRWLQHPCC